MIYVYTYENPLFNWRGEYLPSFIKYFPPYNLTPMGFWDIVDKSKETPRSNADPKVLKNYQRCVKKVISIIGLDLVDNQFVDQLACLEVPMRDKDIIMTLLRSLLLSYEYLITTLKTMPMRELMMYYMTTCLMH